MSIVHNYLVLARNYWGSGETEAEAKRNFRNAGGRLSDEYILMRLIPAPDRIECNSYYGPMLPEGTEKIVIKDTRKRETKQAVEREQSE